MAGSRPPGPLGIDVTPPPIDEGTQARVLTPEPGAVGATKATPAQAPKPPTPITDPDIEKLNLAATARAAAYALKKAHPTVVFTSGRRDKAQQASAMASNVVKNRKWIEETYVASDLRTKCQDWVDKNPTKKTQSEIADGLLSVFNDATDAELAGISKHLSGEAFDVQPVDKDAEAIKTTIRGLSGLTKFLDKEGGLVRWHAQF
jgi:hypothetical protein